MIRHVLAGVAVTSLVGCASEFTYKEPALPEGAAATIDTAFASRRALTIWTNANVRMIDGAPLPGLAADTVFDAAPGRHEFLVTVYFNDGTGGAFRRGNCPCEARMVVTADLAAGRAHAVRGAVDGVKAKAWIVDVESQKPVSDVAEAPYARVPQSSSTIILLPNR